MKIMERKILIFYMLYELENFQNFENRLFAK